MSEATIFEYPYGVFLMERLEFVLLTQDELEAKIMRIIEYDMTKQKEAWQNRVAQAIEAKKTPPKEPKEYWVRLSHAQIISKLYKFDTAKVGRAAPLSISVATLRKALNSLVNKGFLISGSKPGDEYGAPIYTLNRPVIQAAMKRLPKDGYGIFLGLSKFEGEDVQDTDLPPSNFEGGEVNNLNLPPSKNEPPTFKVSTSEVQTLNDLKDIGNNYSQEDTKEESVTPTVADTPTCGASAPAPSVLPLQEKLVEQQIPVTYADCLALLQEHNVAPKGDAVAIMVQARTLYALAHTDLEDEMSVPYARQETVDLQEKGQTDGSSNNHHHCLSNLNSSQPLLRQLDTADDPHRATLTQQKEGLTDGSYSSSTGNNHPSVGSDCPSSEQVTPVGKPSVPPCRVEQVPEQSAFMAPAEPKPRAKAAPKKAVEKPTGPPVAPPAEMEWGTRKCLQWFDFWRGAPLIGKFKLMQASTCAKGLAENYSEAQVLSARTDMEADVYWMSHGGVDVCEVANNIHKYVRRRQSQQQQKVPVGPKLPPRMPTLKELENEVY